MQLVCTLLFWMVCSGDAFRSLSCARRSTARRMGLEGFDLSGNDWKPDSAKMGSTDTGDYYPEGYSGSEIAFTEGWKGSQAKMGGNREGPQLPGMENLGADAIVTAGIARASEIPAGMEFIPSSVPDGVYEMNVASSSSSGSELTIEVPPICMTYEDFYASFSKNSHPSLSVSPATGRMDRRGGVPTVLKVHCDPRGRPGEFVGDLVINLPEDNSKICYRFKVTSF